MLKHECQATCPGVSTVAPESFSDDEAGLVSKESPPCTQLTAMCDYIKIRWTRRVGQDRGCSKGDRANYPTFSVFQNLEEPLEKRDSA
jgi:hypothetical protein